MRRVLYGRIGFTLVLALAFVGIAGVASAQQQICVELIDTRVPITPPLLYRLTVTNPGNNTRSVVGTATQGSATRVVTGGGALIGGQFELSLQSTDIRNTGPISGDRALVNSSTHILLDGPTFTSGIFEAVHVRIFEDLFQSFGQTTTLVDGIATVIPCPPQG